MARSRVRIATIQASHCCLPQSVRDRRIFCCPLTFKSHLPHHLLKKLQLLHHMSSLPAQLTPHLFVFWTIIELVLTHRLPTLRSIGTVSRGPFYRSTFPLSHKLRAISASCRAFEALAYPCLARSVTHSVINTTKYAAAKLPSQQFRSPSVSFADIEVEPKYTT